MSWTVAADDSRRWFSRGRGMGFAKDLGCTMTASNRCALLKEIVEIGVQAFDL
jgi:hypothetical protein